MYAATASAEFNARLHEELSALTQAVQAQMGENLLALILGGGYGRGEGGVIRDAGGEYPYNDIDFTVLVKRKAPDIAAALHAISLPFIQRLRIEIDFSRPLSVADIRDWPHWMMWHDLLNGHQVLYGPADILLAHAPARVRAPLPLIEGTRLLLNRGAGLLWALRVAVAAEDAPDADFIRRNYYKCLLALGDALLVAAGRYTTRYTGRDVLLAEVLAGRADAASWDLLALYQNALRFKFSPDAMPSTQPSVTTLQDCAVLWGKIWLAIEQQRSGMAWRSLADYCQWHGVREPAEHGGMKCLRNLALNARRGRLSGLYPREALYRSVPLLLQTPVTAAQWTYDTAACLAIWQRYN